MNQEIRLFGAVAVRPAVLALISQFETATGFDFDSGISADSRDAEAAKRLSQFLMSADVDGTLTAKGVERC
jgi:molybdate transport system substrate-binding protein